jgi:hypothetical protein
MGYINTGEELEAFFRNCGPRDFDCVNTARYEFVGPWSSKNATDHTGDHVIFTANQHDAQLLIELKDGSKHRLQAANPSLVAAYPNHICFFRCFLSMVE